MARGVFCGVLFSFLVSGSTSAQVVPPFTPINFFPYSSAQSYLAMPDVNGDHTPDVLTPGFLVIGTVLTTLDEDGNALGTAIGPIMPVNPLSNQVPMIIGMDSGKIDGDDLSDVMTVTNIGDVFLLRNNNSHQVDAMSFAAPVKIDSFLGIFPGISIYLHYSFPFFKIADFDLDGINDLVLAGGPSDFGLGQTLPGLICFYKGNGAGGFLRNCLNLTGNPIDGKIADLNGDGVIDSVVVLTETGVAGAFSYDLSHIQWSNGQFVWAGPPLQLNNGGKVTSFDLADVVGDSNKDYIYSTTFVSGGRYSSTISYLQGDGQGGVGAGGNGPIILPPNTTVDGDHIESIRSADLNKDGFDDLVILRGYASAPPNLGVSGHFSGSDLFVVMGPNSAISPQITTYPLGRFHTGGWIANSLFNVMPQIAQPDYVRLADLDGNQNVDILIPGLYRSVGTSNVLEAAVLKNTTPVAPGNFEIKKYGNPSGGVPGKSARFGFDGGDPVVGNSNFGIVIQNIRGGSLVGWTWASNPNYGIFNYLGIDFNIVPEAYGNLGYASGAGLGRGFYRDALPIPNLPSLVGSVGYFQYNYLDIPTGMLGGTQASGLTIGQ